MVGGTMLLLIARIHEIASTAPSGNFRTLLIIDVDDIDFVENKEDFKSIVAQIDAKINKL